VQIIVSVGLRELSWDLISSLPGGSCAQCPHGNAVAVDDEGGGCGVISSGGQERVDPSVSFTGSAAAAYAVLEVCATLGGNGPRFAGRMLSFEYDEGVHRLIQIATAPDCAGHRRLVAGQDYVVVDADGETVSELGARVARALGADARETALASQLEIVRSRACRSCGSVAEIKRPLVVARASGSAPCASCGGAAFDFDVHTALEEPNNTLAECGVAKGKAIIAHVRDRRVFIIRR
jgi:hypothetical protein